MRSLLFAHNCLLNTFHQMVMPSSILESGKKMKCGAYSLDHLKAQLSETLGVSADIVLSLAVSDGEEPTAIQSLDEVGAKAKLQVWPSDHFDGSAAEERAAARAAAAAEAEAAAAVAAAAEAEAAEAARVAAEREAATKQLSE
eukprot:SAG22_NODE_1561_length_4118_cov_4.512814_3_plen_143_part_00